MVNDQAQAMQRNAQMPGFRQGAPGSHLQQMMAAGAPPAEIEAAAMAEAFERDAMLNGAMMPGGGPPPGMFMGPHHPSQMMHGGAFEGGAWGDEFAAGPAMGGPAGGMMMGGEGGAGGAWADEMAMARGQGGAMMGARGRQGAAMMGGVRCQWEAWPDR